MVGDAVPSSVAMVYSHPHYDHIGGAARVAAWLNATYPATPVAVYGTAEAGALVAASASKRAVPPTLVVAAPRTALAVGSVEVRLLMVGGHSASDLAVHIPPTCGGDGAAAAPGVLHFVDVVFPGWSPFAALAITVDVTAYVAAHDALLALDWSVFSGGHLTRLGTRADVVANRAFARDLLAAGAAAVAEVPPSAFGAAGLGQVANASSPVAGNLWFAFLGVVRRLQVDACARRVLADWGCRLAGLDFTVRSHCFVAVTHAVVAG